MDFEKYGKLNSAGEWVRGCCWFLVVCGCVFGLWFVGPIKVHVGFSFFLGVCSVRGSQKEEDSEEIRCAVLRSPGVCMLVGLRNVEG